VSETTTNVAGLLLALKEKGLIAESGSSASPMVLEEKEEVIRVSEKETRNTLRKGSEGAEVLVMQVCSQSLLL
jgi:hypothetical protein